MALSSDVKKGQRIEVLDQMRGIALLGIFLMNIPGLASVTTEAQPVIHEAVKDFLTILLRDSARPLFAVMFGISLSLIYDRFRDKNVNPYPPLLRRLGFLSLVGAVHGYAVWSGDILLMYAMAGFVLLFIMKLKEKWLLVTALIFWLGYTVGMDLLNNYTLFSFDLAITLKSLVSSENYPNGTEYLINEFSSMVRHLGFFLFGMYLHRNHMLSFIAEQRKQMWLTSFVLLAVGFAGKAGMYYEVDMPFFNHLHNFYPFVLTIGLLISIVLWGTSKTLASKLLVPFTAVGRMAFTNYLMQSLVFVNIFNGSGRTIFEDIGIWTEPGYLFVLSVGIVLFVVQMIFSHLWLQKFYYGPFEWLWRISTYGRKVPILRKEN